MTRDEIIAIQKRNRERRDMVKMCKDRVDDETFVPSRENVRALLETIALKENECKNLERDIRDAGEASYVYGYRQGSGES